MAELESVIEKRLIDQLCCDESQWTYRPDIRIEEHLWDNFKYAKYFAAARDTELNRKFISGWLDKDNQPVCDYIDFAKAVLKIPAAHEIVAKYTVLDNDKKRLLILRPYQIHAIEAMREASKKGKSGFIWHTTGSGKTMTSYKATRNSDCRGLG